MTMNTRSRLVPAALALLCLGACVSTPPRATVDRLSTITHEAVLSYNFQTCSATISADQRARMARFLQDLGLNRQDVLVVSVPKGRIPLRDVQRRQTLDSFFAGWPAQVRYVQDDDLRQLPTSESTGIIRVVRPSGVAVDCPPGAAGGNCVSAGNLAAMIARPGDTFLPGTGRRYLPRRGE